MRNVDKYIAITKKTLESCEGIAFSSNPLARPKQSELCEHQGAVYICTIVNLLPSGKYWCRFVKTQYNTQQI